MKWFKPYTIGMAVGIATARISSVVFRPFDEACARTFQEWVAYADWTPPPNANVHTNGILGAFDDYGVWTNAAGWHCAVGGQRPDIFTKRED